MSTDEPSYPSFEEALSMQQAALLKLSPQQLELLMAFVDTLRQQRMYTQRHLVSWDVMLQVVLVKSIQVFIL